MIVLAVYLAVAIVVSLVALRAAGSEPPNVDDVVPSGIYTAAMIGVGLIWPLLLVVAVVGRLRRRS